MIIYVSFDIPILGKPQVKLKSERNLLMFYLYNGLTEFRFYFYFRFYWFDFTV